MNRVVLIGAGHGGIALLGLLLENPEVVVAGVATRTPESAGLAYAREHDIFATNDVSELLKIPEIDVIIDASGSPEVEQTVRRECPPGAEIISGLTLTFMWNMVDERSRRERDQHALYEIGLLLTTANSEQEVLEAILKSTVELIGAPAASIALYRKSSNELQLSCSRGFSKKFESSKSWPVRRGGLSHRILRSEEPVVIEDVLVEAGFDNQVMLNEGIRAVAAVPLRVRKKTIGVLYVDDFKPRRFNTREISLLSLLAHQAALAIDKAHLLEDKVRLATTDGMTGIFNYRHFKDVLRSEVERASRYSQNFCMAILDLDFFKTINDRMGHTKGDEVLRLVAHTIKENLRNTDFLARYGGEEFVVILPHTSLGESHQAVEKIRKAISDIKVTGKHGENLRLTASLGVADFPASGISSDDLIAAADTALLLAKRSGRNRVCYFPDVGNHDAMSTDDGLSSRLRGHDFLTVGALVAALQEAENAHKSQALVAADFFSGALDLSREEREALLLGVQIHRRGHLGADFSDNDTLVSTSSFSETPGGLTDNEWSVIRKHSASVARVIRAIQGINNLTSTILHHHERWDGKGHPDGLAADEIPLLARILSICESYQELVDPKPSGKGLRPVDALAALQERAGKELDPALVSIFCEAPKTDGPASDLYPRGASSAAIPRINEARPRN